MDKKKNSNLPPRRRLGRFNPILIAKKAFWSGYYFNGHDYDGSIRLIEHNIHLLLQEFIKLLSDNGLITEEIADDGEIKLRYDRVEIERILDNVFDPHKNPFVKKEAYELLRSTVEKSLKRYKKLFFGTFKIYADGERDFKKIAEKLGISFITYASEMYYMSWNAFQYGYAETITGLSYKRKGDTTLSELTEPSDTSNITIDERKTLES